MKSSEIVQKALDESIEYANKEIPMKHDGTDMERYWRWESIRISKLKELLVKIIDENN